ncbi:restriction endonuclease [Streptomyces sp. NPDC003036]|uniref:restriction endonuclease n=1 Tax=Streptomyces sp. NPDC003036 TaxID=3154442 RepID=UPI0033B4A6BD
MTRSADHAATDPKWRVYEKAVAEYVRQLDPGVTVEHDQHLPGLLSGRPRQIDVLVRGRLAGETILIVWECKDYARPVGLGTVEEFISKLVDVGAHKGVLICSEGLTEAAVRRLENTTQPRVSAYQFQVAQPEETFEDWFEDLSEELPEFRRRRSRPPKRRAAEGR